MFGQTAMRARTYFKVSCIGNVVNEVGVQNKEIPECLEGDDSDNSLELVIQVSSQTATMLAYVLSQVAASRAVEAFYMAIFRQVANLPKYQGSTDGYFKLNSAEEFIEEIDRHEDDFEVLKQPKAVECSLEIILTMTTKFAFSIMKIIDHQRPGGILELFCDALYAKLGELGKV